MKKVLLSAICIIVMSNLALAQIYYDIDFSSPVHTVGSKPKTGSGIDTPSSIVFGSPVVSDSLGLLDDQPLVFNSQGNSPSFYYDQIKLDLDFGTGFYYTSFDITTQSLIGSENLFRLHFDTPQVQNITFLNTGMIDLFGKKQVIYKDNTLMNLEILMDIAAKQTSILINDIEVYNGAFNPREYLGSLRFNHGLQSQPGGVPADISSFVGLDNIFVADFVPEPTTMVLLGIGGLALRKRRSA